MTQEIKNCQNCKKDFTIEPDDFTFYEKMKVPAPTFCPECRLIRRLSWRNEKTFYRRTCDKCNKSIISVFSPETKLTVYCSPCWWGDEWDASDYGVDFDPNRSFMLQVRDLLQRVPIMNLFGLYTTLENSDYTNMVSYLKNCHMVTYSDFGENITYGSFVNHSKDSVDNLMIEQCELCYEDVNCNKCFQTFFSVDCESCSSVYFSKNCVGCSDCFGCANLRKKKYYIFNEPYDKESYKIKLAVKSKGKGKSGGLRVISHIDAEVIGLVEPEGDAVVVTLISIYDKSETATISVKELQDLIASLKHEK